MVQKVVKEMQRPKGAGQLACEAYFPLCLQLATDGAGHAVMSDFGLKRVIGLLVKEGTRASPLCSCRYLV